MKKKEIKEGNEIIARFMGGLYSKHAEAWGFGDAIIVSEYSSMGKLYKDVVKAQKFEKELKYHKSWNWLIPVISHMHTLAIEEYTAFDEIDSGLIYTNIEATWKAVVDFIKWYDGRK